MGMLFVHALTAADVRAGDVACESTGHHHDSAPEDCGTSPGCCHGLCPTVFLALSSPLDVCVGAANGVIFSRMEVMPDAPVREIEHPPQLS